MKLDRFLNILYTFQKIVSYNRRGFEFIMEKIVGLGGSDGYE